MSTILHAHSFPVVPTDDKVKSGKLVVLEAKTAAFSFVSPLCANLAFDQVLTMSGCPCQCPFHPGQCGSASSCCCNPATTIGSPPVHQPVSLNHQMTCWYSFLGPYVHAMPDTNISSHPSFVMHLTRPLSSSVLALQVTAHFQCGPRPNRTSHRASPAKTSLSSRIHHITLFCSQLINLQQEL